MTGVKPTYPKLGLEMFVLTYQDMKEQTDIIQISGPEPILLTMYNYKGFGHVDCHDLGKRTDFGQSHLYPGDFSPMSPTDAAISPGLHPDTMVRSYKNKNFWIAEQQSGITGWEVMLVGRAGAGVASPVVPPVGGGCLRLDAVVYFRWRV